MASLKLIAKLLKINHPKRKPDRLRVSHVSGVSRVSFGEDTSTQIGIPQVSLFKDSNKEIPKFIPVTWTVKFQPTNPMGSMRLEYLPIHVSLIYGKCR